ncbi:MAG: hypothetical protein AB7P08_17270 [Burkholderiales bacterium]
MSELRDRMLLLRDSLAAQLPARVVTREWRPITTRRAEDLEAGIYSVVSQGESGYPNLNGWEARDGKHRIAVIAQLKLPESASPEAVEDAEFELVAEMKAFVRSLPQGLCCLLLTAFTQSGQLEAPYGWVIFELESVSD